MIINKEVADFINNILDCYGINESRTQIFNTCYVAALDAKVNPRVDDYWSYVRTIVVNTVKPLVESALNNVEDEESKE